MYNHKFESVLMAEQPTLYRSIKKKSVKELNLPMRRHKTIIGFGKLLNFYMFWINQSQETFYFNARRIFIRDLTDNLIKIEFIEANQEAIFHAIDEIYNSYLQAKSDVIFSQQLSAEKDQDLVRAVRSKKQVKISETMLLWDRVTRLIFAKIAENEHRDVDEDYAERLRLCGRRMIDLFDNIMYIIESQSSESIARNMYIYRECLESDQTLADIASQYNVCRERIRQIVKRVNSYASSCFKKAMFFDNEEFNECIEKLAALFEDIDYRVVDLIAYGLTEIGDRKIQAVFTTFFGNKLSQKLIEESKVYLR